MVSCVKTKRIDYHNLPSDFWDKVIYYEYFITHSGHIEIDPYVTVWTNEGKQYYINTIELRDGRFERVIPFFEVMADKEKIANGDFFYFDWEKAPAGWKYLYMSSNHCFVPDAVYEEIIKAEEDEKKAIIEENNYNEKRLRKRDILWKKLLFRAVKTVYEIDIDESEKNYIRFDEKIHVYYEPFDGVTVKMDQISKEEIAKLKQAAVWYIEYTSPIEGLRNLIKIVYFFETDKPHYLQYNFNWLCYDYMDEDEFMERLMDLFELDLGNTEKGYSFDKAMNGYTNFRIKDDVLKTYWIRDDLYQSNFSNVIEPLMNYAGNTRFLRDPICACRENKEGFISE